MVPMVVEARVLGSAYGLCTALQNIGLAIGPTIVGALTFKDSSEKEDTSGANNNAFNYVSIVLGGFALLGVLSSITLLIVDKVKLNGKLQKPDNDDENEEDGDNQENEDHVEDMDHHNHEHHHSAAYKAHVKRSIARSSMAK
uniref:Major facilitator superfamily (MFS) profile domain-containing protein n=1 Tax=Euplotes crassus TaxID=5936 RepID=A0A7S3K627_EUPCR|mmetsp:Transcript_11707/g.11651  ORF Transcript_11707/g.11651 Transcript_11707/m.11651 type:complete len:142 (+) Transcript_11707:1200-1625(+)